MLEKNRMNCNATNHHEGEVLLSNNTKTISDGANPSVKIEADKAV